MMQARDQRYFSLTHHSPLTKPNGLRHSLILSEKTTPYPKRKTAQDKISRRGYDQDGLSLSIEGLDKEVLLGYHLIR